MYPLPKAGFTILPSSDQCLYSNKICINNNSTKSSSNIDFSKFVVIWGDGGGDIDSIPLSNNPYCHSYKTTGNFDITIEITDLKGCKSKASKQTNILPDIKADFEVTDSSICEEVQVCLKNKTTGDTNNISAYN